jgi:hypothetical protein
MVIHRHISNADWTEKTMALDYISGKAVDGAESGSDIRHSGGRETSYGIIEC